MTNMTATLVYGKKAYIEEIFFSRTDGLETCSTRDLSTTNIIEMMTFMEFAENMSEKGNKYR